MRVLIFHGYLLTGTGSNVYAARLAAALVKRSAEVHLLSQDRHASAQPFVDAVADWDDGRLRVRVVREPVRCTVYRPAIGPLLPVYVADRYEGVEARTFLECGDAEIAAYVEANVQCVRDVVGRVGPDLALANHLVMGPLVLARALGSSVPYAVKVHGSALEYTVKADPRRFVGAAREGLAGARTVLVGSAHSARSLWAALDCDALPARTFLGPPGVDLERFAPGFGAGDDGGSASGRETGAGEPRDRGRSVRLDALAMRLRSSGESAREESERTGREPSAFARDPAEGARALARLAAAKGPLVAFVGKLIVSKGADLLVAAWPLVLEHAPEACLALVGFGAWRAALERLVAALGAGDLEEARGIARAGRALEDPPGAPAPLGHLLGFLESLRGDAAARYLRHAAGLGGRVALTGRLEHAELAPLLAVCEAVVVPSTFPESFGMIAVEAAACGALPISARHSGLAEVSAALARGLPAEMGALLSFELGADPVRGIAARLAAWLSAPEATRAPVRAGLAAAVRERFSWDGVARDVIAAARGEHRGLLAPAGVAPTFGGGLVG